MAGAIAGTIILVIFLTCLIALFIFLFEPGKVRRYDVESMIRSFLDAENIKDDKKRDLIYKKVMYNYHYKKCYTRKRIINLLEKLAKENFEEDIDFEKIREKIEHY